MEVTFRSPDRRETVLIRKLRSFEQQSVFVLGTACFVSCEIEQAEVHLPGFYFRIDFGLCASYGQGLSLKYHFETARQSPQQFEHGDVKGNTGDGQPYPVSSKLTGVHAGEKVDHIIMANHDALGLARG